MVEDPSIQLKVFESIQDDVNKGIVRIDSSYMRHLGIRPGNIVEITGNRTTVAIADRALPGDYGLNIIRMDGLVRHNAKTSMGEFVTVKSVEPEEAKKIVIAPTRPGISFQTNRPDIFQQGLLGRVAVKGDIISVGGTSRRQSTMGDLNDIFKLLDSQQMGFIPGFGLGDMKFIVTEVNPSKKAVIITKDTIVEFAKEGARVTQEEKENLFPEVSYEDVGGLEDEIKKVREMVELPLKHPEIFDTLGIEPPKGVLLRGPPGTGKTLLAKAVAHETNSHFIVINGPEIMSKFYGQSEENLRKIFEEAEQKAPSIIFIDEIDAIATKREEAKGDVEKRVVAQLLTIMDGLNARGKIIVMAATNMPNSLDPALRRPGRFDREIEIGVPSTKGRLQILKIHTRNMPLYPTIKKRYLEEYIADLKLRTSNEDEDARESDKKQLMDLEELNRKLTHNDSDNEQLFLHMPKEAQDKYRIIFINGLLMDIAKITHGFVGADLSALTKESAMAVLRREYSDLNVQEDETISKDVLKRLVIRLEDFKDSLNVVRPSALRELLVEKPTVGYDSIGGLEDVKQEISEAVEWPLNHKDKFISMGIKPPTGVLLYGPPGTGKTLLAKAIAKESEANFLSIKGPELLSKWIGESEKAVRKVFEKARQTSPTIIFFDEIDAIAHRRTGGENNEVTERVVNQLLTEMDGLEDLNDVVVIAATNRPDIVDTALLRPGRFDRIILVDIPDFEGRKKIFEVHLKKMPLAKDVVLTDLADATEGYVGADIQAVCREAAIMALREDMSAKKVSNKHFEEALKKVRPSADKEVQKAYQDLKNHFSSARGKEMAKEKPSYYG